MLGLGFATPLGSLVVWLRFWCYRRAIPLGWGYLVIVFVIKDLSFCLGWLLMFFFD